MLTSAEWHGALIKFPVHPGYTLSHDKYRRQTADGSPPFDVTCSLTYLMKRSKRSILAFGFLAKNEGAISLDFTPPHPIYQHRRPFQVANTK